MSASLGMAQSGNATLERSQVAAWFGRSLGQWTVRAVGGGVFGGQWRADNVLVAVTPGWIAGVSASRMWSDGDSVRPYLRSTFALAAARHGLADGGTITAADLRISGEAGWRLGAGVQVYAAAAAFGGPVVWSRPGHATDWGGDRWHVQAGGGAAWSPQVQWAARPSVFVQAMVVGELGVSAGLGLSL